MTKVAYEPISAKDALKQIKDLCSIMVDLAYSAILFEDKALVDEVKELRDSIVHLEYLLTMSLQLTVRDGKAAEATLPLVVLGNASTDIANCAVDIANVLTKGFTVHPTIKELAQKTSQNLARGKISEESILKDYSIREIVEKMNYSVSIVAVRKDNKWLIKPDGEMQLEAGNFLIASGSNSGISLLKMLIGGAAEEISPVEDDDIDQDEIEVLTDNIVDYLIGLKDTSEVMVDIAYGAVLYNSKELAQLVSNMEKRVDTIRNKAEIAVLKIAKTPTEDISSLQGLLRIIEATEDISDAANQIAKIVLEEIPSHPIIELVIEESDESIFEQTVEDASVIVGKTIPTGNYLDEFGIRVLALKRAAGHFFKPRRRTKIRVGDTIVFTGLKNACTAN
ncbi:MAG: potassium channel family protein [Candidatus Heimdallarchaeota archaeon]